MQAGYVEAMEPAAFVTGVQRRRRDRTLIVKIEVG